VRRRLLVGVVVFATIALTATPGFAKEPPVRDSQWHLGFLNIPQAHAISKGEGVIVAVIDTGVDASHPDLAGSILPGVDLSGVTATAGGPDIDGHGTAMAGLIVAHGSALGIAPAARVLPIRDGVSYVDARNVSPAIDWAVAHGAKVLSLSLGIPNTPELSAAVKRALDADVVVVAGVGNKPESAGVGYPAAYDGVIAAAGVDRNGQHAEISVVGFPVVLAAPAVNIISTGPSNTYRQGTGTSDATAIIAGAAALVRSEYPRLSAKEVYHRLTATADDKGPPGRDIEYGYGVVNLVKALTADVPPLTPSATPRSDAAEDKGSSLPTRTVLIGAIVAVALAAAGATLTILLTRRR
jgi:type VII secretion-associated serine protease mycosin